MLQQRIETVSVTFRVIDAGVVKFALRYRPVIDSAICGVELSAPAEDDQGLCIEVLGDVAGKEVELLRFDCFDQRPHYHYGPGSTNETLYLDKTTVGNPIGWTLKQLRARLPEMVWRAGYGELADKLSAPKQAELLAVKLNEVEANAREMAAKQRRTQVHYRGDEVIEAGNIKFGLEYRPTFTMTPGRGVTIHVLSDVEGQEIEILAFDCFDQAPHYHYGPRNKDVRIYWDTTLVPDTLRWTLDQFTEGKLPAMIERAGYPGVAAELDTVLIASVLENEVVPKALALCPATTNNSLGNLTK